MMISLAWAGVNAQTILYEQNFDNTGGVIPTDITLINADGFLAYDESDAAFNDSAWIVGNTNRVELQGTLLAISCSYYENYAVPADDWMILPSITIGNNTALTWDAMSLTSSGNYPDQYQVLVAPSADGVTPTKAYFEENGQILFEVMEESSAAVSNPGQGLMHRLLNLSDSGFAGTPVWIAFRLVTGGDGGCYLGVDNIKVEETVSVNPIEKAKITVFPNPANETIRFYFEGSQGQIQLLDITGKLIRHIDNALNGASMHVNDLAAGCYFVRITSGNQVYSQKIMIK